jgi:hypothetical protein
MTKFNNKAQQNAVKASAYVEQIEEICKARIDFEQNEQARSNKRLYEILADVQRLFEQAAGSKGALKDTVMVLTQRLEAKGARIQSNTKALALFVRYVFNSERQATHIYTRAIQYAISEGVEADGLAEFIVKAGGIDGCKKQAKPSEKLAAKKLIFEKTMPLVNELLDGQTAPLLGEVTVHPRLVEKTHQDGFTFLIGKADKSGKVNVLSVVPAQSEAFLNWAKKELALYLSEQHQADGQQAKVIHKDAAIEAAVNAAITKMQSGEATLAEVLEA